MNIDKRDFITLGIYIICKYFKNYDFTTLKKFLTGVLTLIKNCGETKKKEDKMENSASQAIN